MHRVTAHSGCSPGPALASLELCIGSHPSRIAQFSAGAAILPPRASRCSGSPLLLLSTSLEYSKVRSEHPAIMSKVAECTEMLRMTNSDATTASDYACSQTLAVWHSEIRLFWDVACATRLCDTAFPASKLHHADDTEHSDSGQQSTANA